jgi:hypothetical protein
MVLLSLDGELQAYTLTVIGAREEKNGPGIEKQKELRGYCG